MDTKKLLEDVIDSTEDGVYFVDQNRTITQWNKAAERITGYSAAKILNRQCQDNILYHIDGEGRPLCLVGCPLYATLGDGEKRTAEVFLRHKDGHRVAALVKVLPVYEDGKIIGAFEIFTPRAKITENNGLVDSLADKAFSDGLTGLHNHAYLEYYLEYKLEEFKRFGRSFCVAFLDLDNFGKFNNTYGHNAGDSALRAISASFAVNLSDSDAFGRWGGEEFLGVFSANTAPEAFKIAEKCRVLVKGSEIEIDGQRVSLTASVGVALINDRDTAASITGRADRLMYMSKRRTKNCITVENPANENCPFMTTDGSGNR